MFLCSLPEISHAFPNPRAPSTLELRRYVVGVFFVFLGGFLYLLSFGIWSPRASENQLTLEIRAFVFPSVFRVLGSYLTSVAVSSLKEKTKKTL